MPRLHSSAARRAQSGIALVVALVLLLVMTMVAVVAMRTTTVDLKMITNTVLTRRAFQNSEGGRMAMGKTLEAHVFYRGWPVAAGGTVPNTASFPIPIELTVVSGTAQYYDGSNGNLVGCDGKEARTPIVRDADLEFESDIDADAVVDNEDVFADIWVTWRAALLAAGSGGAQGSGYLGPGVGSAGADSNVFFDIKSRGQAPGNAVNCTGADYRVLVRN